MKRSFAILILLIGNCLFAQIVDIPDPIFKDSLVNYPVVDTNGDSHGDADADTNDDGEIQVVEAEAVLGLYITLEWISSLEGLQSFINLEKFRCINNFFDSIDVTSIPNLKELILPNAQLTSIDVSQNLNLEVLNLWENELSAIDVSNNTNLKYLNLTNNYFNNLDVSQNESLEYLSISQNNFSFIDITQNVLLKELYISNNNFTNINIAQNINLESFHSQNNQMNTIDISQNTNLKILFCHFNLLTDLDASQNSQLTYISCSNNLLTNLNIKNSNNINLNILKAVNNSNLDCIQVDDVNFANSQSCETSSGWCIDETAVYSEDCSLGLNEVLETQFSIYPNPASDVLIIEKSNLTSITKIKVFDVLGKLVLEQNNPSKQIDVSKLPTGLFFIHIQTDNGTAIKKVIKE